MRGRQCVTERVRLGHLRPRSQSQSGPCHRFDTRLDKPAERQPHRPTGHDSSESLAASSVASSHAQRLNPHDTRTARFMVSVRQLDVVEKST